MPSALRAKLGDEATEGLVDMFTVYQKDQDSRFVRIFQDTLALRILTSEEKMMGCIRESEDKMTARIQQSEDKMTARIQQSEDKMTARIQQSEDKMTARIQQSEEKMTARIEQTEEKLTARMEQYEEKTSKRFDAMGAEISDLRKETHAGFLNVQKEITGVHYQITRQTRWLIGVASFLVVAMKAVDMIIKYPW